MGSQSSTLERPSSADDSSSSQPTLPPLPRRDESREEPRTHSYRSSNSSNSYHYDNRDRKHKRESSHASGKMTDPRGRPIHGIGGFSERDEDNRVESADQDDFGTLEIFDSNASEAPYSSQANGKAKDDAHYGSDDAMLPPPRPRSSKRSKKDKKRRESHDENDAAPSSEGIGNEKKRKSKKHASYEVPDSQPADSTDAVHGDNPSIPSSHSKKKRRLSDSAESKRHKKRRSQDPDVADDVVHGTQGDLETHGTASTFLRRRGGKGARNAIFEENGGSSQSPSVARTRRRSQSRENSAPPQDQANAMDVDHDLGTEQQGHDGPNTDDIDRDVESLAREAWNEHRNGQKRNAAQDPDPDPDVDLQDANANADDEPSGPALSTSPKRTRSSRNKKAKPTYFEQPIVDNFAADELPSPSAMTPKPRKRTKRATKKKEKEKLSQSMRGGSEEVEGKRGRKPRKNRMAGFTQGRFTEEELGRIAEVIESFRSDSDLTQQQVNEMIQAPGGTTAGHEHAELWSRLFEVCPDRHRQKVINVARKKFHNFVARGAWTPDQDTELVEMINIHGTSWAKIGGLINRHPEDLRDRYRNYLVCGDAQRKDAWEESEEARLTQYVIDAMEAIDQLREQDPTRELLQRSYEELIDWQHISERMDRTRSRLQCITKWKSMHIRAHGKDKLESQAPDAQISFGLEKARRQIRAMQDEDKYRLVLAISVSQVGSDAKISWQKLVDKSFRNEWHRPTLMLLWHRLRQTVPGGQEMKPRDLAEYLKNQYDQVGELPELGDEKFDDADEMAFMQTLPISATPRASRKSGLDVELVGNSDGEAEERNGDDAVDPEDGDMKIDPALTAEAPSEPPPNKAAPAKKGSSKKQKKSKKAATGHPTDDPIDEEEVARDDGVDAAENDQDEIDETRLRKKKTPSKFKSPYSGQMDDAASPERSASESLMDDMEDLPATVVA